MVNAWFKLYTMLSYYQYSIILETFYFDSNNMFPFCFSFKKMVQILHHLLPSGNKYSQKLSETYHILKYWKNMLTCRSVWGFECLVSIFSFKFFIRFSLHQKMNHNYFWYLRCFVVGNFALLGVPDHGTVPNHGPIQGAICTKQMMVLYHTCDTWCFWTKSWCWTSSICGTSL